MKLLNTLITVGNNCYAGRAGQAGGTHAHGKKTVFVTQKSVFLINNLYFWGKNIFDAKISIGHKSQYFRTKIHIFGWKKSILADEESIFSDGKATS